MKLDEKTLEKIDRFLSGKMTDKETAQFKILIEENKTLEEAVLLTKDINRSLIDPVSLDIEAQLKTLGKKHGDKYAKEIDYKAKNDKKRSLLKWLIFAICILIIFIFFNHKKNQKTSISETLYAQYYSSYESSDQIRALDSSNDNSIKLSTLYQNQEFDEIIIETDKNLAESLQIDKSLFYKSLALIELKQLDEAINTLKTVSNMNNSGYQQQSTWYLALIQLKQGKIDLAKENLEKVRDLSNRGKYHSNANLILESLD